jgi:hypothetical protein
VELHGLDNADLDSRIGSIDADKSMERGAVIFHFHVNLVATSDVEAVSVLVPFTNVRLASKVRLCHNRPFPTGDQEHRGFRGALWLGNRFSAYKRTLPLAQVWFGIVNYAGQLKSKANVPVF